MVRRPLIFGPLFVAAIFAVIVALYWPTFYVLVDLAGTSAENYTHRTIVLPIFFALLWGQRFELAMLPVRSVWWGVAGLIAAGSIWLIGELVFVRLLTDLAVIAMVPFAVLTVLGPRWLAALSFPLAFLLFAIPAEGPLIPSLVNWTAKATFAGIQASGVPIYREGAYFVIPSGGWSIADACSGIKYLITCLMLGVLYAWSMYRSTLKRILFIGGAIVIGVVGNWMRAYLTMMIAHVSDNRLLRDDHSTFGWILFAVFLLGYGWLGWRFREVQDDEVPVSLEPCAIDCAGPERSSGGRATVAAALMLAALAAWPLVETVLLRSQQDRAIDIAGAVSQRGWSPVDKRSVEWTPELKNPRRVRMQSFEKNGSRVEVFTGIFENQTWNSKLVSSVNQFVDSDNPNWSLADRGRAHTEISGKPLELKTGVVLGRGDRILAWQWYWIDGASIGSDIQAKFRQLLARIQGRGDSSAWVAIYTKANASPDAATRVLDEFMRDMGDSLERAIIISTQR